MMEILHRAKRIDTGEWVIGYYNKRHGVYGEVDFMFWSNAYNHWDNVEIDPKTVCVYIGLEDESKNKIWEHDFVSIHTYSYWEPEDDLFGEIVYSELLSCWCIKQAGTEEPIPLRRCRGSFKTEIYVRGNSIDNPELLGV